MSEYKPITGELRNMPQRYDNFANVEKVVFNGEDFDRLCDAIDIIHASLEVENERLKAELDCVRDELNNWESTHVELPKDADGEPIHVGDVMEWVRYEDDDPTIVREVSAVGRCVFFAWSNEQGRFAQYEAHAYRHYHAPTVEDVLREMADRIYADEDEPRDRDAIVAEYAKRLTLAGDAE